MAAAPSAGSKDDRFDPRAWQSWRVPAALVGLSAVVRIGAALQTAAIFNDGPAFLRLAALFHERQFAQALAHAYHPLYPVSIALVAPWIGEFEHAGLVVSLTAGSLAVLGLYAFLARAFDRQVAVGGGILFALHPYAARFSADVQSEGLYFALFLAALACVWRALEEAAPRRAVLAGALTGAAYLVRPEGLGVAACGVAFAALLLFQGRWSVPVFSRWTAALVLGVAFVAAPYVVHLHQVTGQWILTQKKSLSDFTSSAGASESPGERPAHGVPDRRRFRLPPLKRSASIVPARIDFEPRAVGAFFDLGVVAVGALHPIAVVLVALGLLGVRGPPGDRGRFLLLLLALYGAVLYALALNVGYLDRRHVLAPLLPLLGYAALGLPVLGGLLLRPLRGRGRVFGEARAAWLAIALVALLTLPKTWAPHREERLATRRAAEWLAARDDLTGPVAAEKHRTAWYAGEAFIQLARGGVAGRAADLSRAGARFVIVDDKQLRARPALEAQRATLPELHRVEAGGRTAFVYDLAQDLAQDLGAQDLGGVDR